MTLLVTYREALPMNTGNKNPIFLNEYPTFPQNSMSSPLVIESVKNKCRFFLQNDSNSLGTVDYDAQKNTKADSFINHKSKPMTIQKLITLYHICGLEGTQVLTVLAKSFQNLQLVGYNLTANRSNFLFEEGSTAWLFDCPQLRSPLYEADESLDHEPIYYQDIVMHIDLVPKQYSNYVTATSCNNTPHTVIALDPDKEEHFVLTPKLVVRATRTVFEPKTSPLCNKPKHFHRRRSWKLFHC